MNMLTYKAGKTPLIKVNEFCEKFGLPNLRVKDESHNPFGTWKDRRSEAIVKKAQKELADKICLITSGNAGFSLAKFAERSRIKVVSVISTSLASSIKHLLVKVCSQLIEKDLSKNILKPEEVIALAREDDQEVIYDATNGFHEAYESIIKEIKKTAPEYIICPVGSGEAFVGLFFGLKKAKLKTKLIGVTVKASPSFADKLHTPWTPYSAKMKSMLEMGHRIISLKESEVKEAFKYAKKFIDCEPSSAVVLGVFSKIKFKPTDKIILINSGKGLR